MKLNTNQIELALMDYFNPRQNIIVPNVSWGISYKNKLLHECDILIVTKAGIGTEIEIKISKLDLLKDRKKWHQHRHILIRRLYFAVPEELKELALTEIPERAGLLICKYDENKFNTVSIYEARKPKLNKVYEKFDLNLMFKVARLGCMRIPNLLKKSLNHSYNIH